MNTPISARFTGAIAALALLAGAVAWQAELAPRRIEACADPIALLDPLAIDPGSAPPSDRTWAADRTRGRVSGVLPGEDPRDADLDFLVLRTWGLPQGIQNPSLYLPGRLEPDRLAKRRLAADGGEIPVFEAMQEVERRAHFASYFYAYGDRAVTSPGFERLLRAPGELVRGSRPITLFAVSGRVSRFELARARERADRWLASAWQHYRRACGFN
jgi:hypothetical protein